LRHRGVQTTAVAPPNADDGPSGRDPAGASGAPSPRLGPDVELDPSAVIHPGAIVDGPVRIHAECHIGPGVVFDGRRPTGDAGPTIVQEGVQVGANASVRRGVTIGRHAVVETGAVVLANVPPFAVVAGNPAQIVGYLDSTTTDEPEAVKRGVDRVASPVAEVELIRVPTISDLRGDLIARQASDGGLPFVPQRIFVIRDVPSMKIRGEHAHRECKQLLTCLCGSLKVVVDDGQNRQDFLLNSPELALYLPPMVWGMQYNCSADCVLLVLASHPYDPDDYIRDYEQFPRERRGGADPA